MLADNNENSDINIYAFRRKELSKKQKSCTTDEYLKRTFSTVSQ